MHEIAPYVWIGSLRALEDTTMLRTHDIQHNINASCSQPGWAIPAEQDAVLPLPLPLPPTQCLSIQVLDDKHANMLQHLDVTRARIDAAVALCQPILVNCAQGKSRSGTIVIDWLMRSRGHTFKQALAICRAQRPCVRPNSGFRHQLCTRQLLPKKLSNK